MAPAIANDGAGTTYIDQATYDALEARVVVVEGLATTADALFGDLSTELATAIAASDSHIDLINDYILAIGNINENRGFTNSLLFPSRTV